ncbi:unnamed protein product [Rotaria sordida]|uniref:NADH dehydrogenase [ubiquinone] 1 alpha subcomplex subunit 7 n=1 Tax=Rotaria sordida TaxID=392033 RepID=A0A814C2U4_9BILA|nr:unnamed protein product [Rotaria sordida]CAF1005051.1 unnamed protein product [Rotaria sordida]CAF3727470.1 unnamed protein product [Rotaria sordida]CAF3772692.1 unnamed protein product [Rotaria sordida]
MSSNVKQVAEKAAPVVKRDINKWLAMIRQFLMLRDFTHNQRHEFEWSKRTQPQPFLPTGFAHKLNKNYYFDRDARRQVGPPQVVFSTTTNQQFLASSVPQQQLTAGTATQAAPQQSVNITSNTSEFVSINEAEKQTASLLAAQNNKEQKTRSQPRVPGKIFNWDG